MLSCYSFRVIDVNYVYSSMVITIYKKKKKYDKLVEGWDAMAGNRSYTLNRVQICVIDSKILKENKCKRR